MTAPRLRPLGRLAGVAGLLLLLPLLGLSPASAHTALVESDPAAGATLSEAPATIDLTFTEQISPDLSAVTLRVDGAKAVTLELGSGARPEVVRASVPAGVAGESWTVAYRVVSGDGHPVTGELSFSVAAPDAAASSTPTPSAQAPDAEDDASPGVEESDDTEDTSTGWWWAIGGLVAVLVIGLVLYAGGRRRARR